MKYWQVEYLSFFINSYVSWRYILQATANILQCISQIAADGSVAQMFHFISWTKRVYLELDMSIKCSVKAISKDAARVSEAQLFN